MFHIFLYLSIYISSIVDKSAEENNSHEIEDNENSAAQRIVFLNIETISLLRRLNIILDCLQIGINETNKRNITKISNDFMGIEDNNSSIDNFLAKWEYSLTYIPFFSNNNFEKLENINIVQNDNKLKSFEKKFDLDDINKINKKVNDIILKEKQNFDVKFVEIERMISMELMECKWINVIDCIVFIGEEHIEHIIRSFCRCRRCWMIKYLNNNRVRLKHDESSKKMFFGDRDIEYDTFLRHDNNESIVKYTVYYFRDNNNKIYLTDENKEMLSKNTKYNTDNLNTVAEIIHNFYSSEVDHNDPKFVVSLLYEYISLFLCKHHYGLMLFMRSPFGFWESVRDSKAEKHEFVDDSYEVLIKNNCFKGFNIYRKKNKNEFKYIAVQINSKIKKCFDWGNGVIIGNSSYIEENVQIGEFSYIGPEVKISKNVKIGRECTIFTGVKINENSIIDDLTTIPRDSIINYI